jgi:hypothetical protein
MALDVKLEKAKLKWSTLVPPLFGEIECQFNPNELVITKENNWASETMPNFNSPSLKFLGGSPATYKLDLFFDSFAPCPGKDPIDVRSYTNKLLKLTLRGAGLSMFKIPYSTPPTVKFIWGKITLFTAVVTRVNISFIMFAQDGTPTRAKAAVEFKQSEFLMGDDMIPALNPSSRTDARKTRIVNSHQRLDQIAYEEFGDARYWRVLAEANNIDDPFRLQDGQLMAIPQDNI